MHLYVSELVGNIRVHITKSIMEVKGNDNSKKN